MGSLPSSAPPLPRLVWVSFWEGGAGEGESVSFQYVLVIAVPFLK